MELRANMEETTDMHSKEVDAKANSGVIVKEAAKPEYVTNLEVPTNIKVEDGEIIDMGSSTPDSLGKVYKIGNGARATCKKHGGSSP